MKMREIQVDFDIHKLIEQNRHSFEDTPNNVLRRLLKLPAAPKERQEQREEPSPRAGLVQRGVYIPGGLRLRKFLKGELHEAQVVDGGIRYQGKTYDSPSAAACKAAGNSVNGWIFWDYFDESTGRWRSLNDLRRGRKIDR